MTTDVRKVGVLGLGTMGAGIAQVSIQAGVPTVGRDLSQELVERGRAAIEGPLAREVSKERMTEEDRSRALELLETTTRVEALSDCDLVIEAVPEELAVKQELFAAVERVVSAETVLATNTSALSVTAIAAGLSAPERVVGMHFFNPVPVLPLVEVVQAERTSDRAREIAEAFVVRIGKQPIVCRDTPGFVVNRMLIPVLNEAVRLLDEGVASAEAIDLGMHAGASWPIGPLALLDLIGIDTYAHVCNALWDAYHETRFSPPPRIERMAKAGLLGRKSGRGFYDYQAGESSA